jgi:CheY-like chemotaxis protein
MSLRFLMEREGFQVEVAPTGEAALAASISAPADLVLLDVMMPELDRFEVCQRIRIGRRRRRRLAISRHASRHRAPVQRMARTSACTDQPRAPGQITRGGAGSGLTAACGRQNRRAA